MRIRKWSITGGRTLYYNIKAQLRQARDAYMALSMAVDDPGKGIDKAHGYYPTNMVTSSTLTKGLTLETSSSESNRKVTMKG